MGHYRIVIVNKNRLAVFGQILQHVIHDFVLLVFRHFVQQEEAANQVIIACTSCESRRIAPNNLGPFHVGQFARPVFDLCWRDIGQMEKSGGADLLCDTLDQIAINMRHLPDTHSRRNFIQIGAHQALIVQKQQDAHDNVAIE